MFEIEGITVRRKKTADRTANPFKIGEILTSAIRSGYSLVEVMIAITLTLILMYGIASMFSQVTSIMSETERTLMMANDLRTVKDRLYEDLTHLTVPKLQAPTSQYGFFCYQEGLGADINTIFNGGDYRKPINQTVAINGDKYRANLDYNNLDNLDAVTDKTVGDTDDILSFTARAPEGKWFKGRLLNGFDANGYPVTEIVESEYAEIVWFVRGTTLYRRVLLIVSDNVLQNRLARINDASINVYDTEVGKGNTAVNLYNALSKGYGFYKYFDVSVHLNEDTGFIEANTLADLANRKNRYGYWRSPVQNKARATVNNLVYRPDYALHGYAPLYDFDDDTAPIDAANRLAWYWLRLPTLQESATADYFNNVDFSVNNSALFTRFFGAGIPFGQRLINDDNLAWLGSYQHLNYNGLYHWGLGSLAENFPARTDTGMKRFSKPFIDYWVAPYPWTETDAFSGTLSNALYPFRNVSATGPKANSLNQDVILTNVLSFNVKAWNDASASFVDLGDLAASYDRSNNVYLDKKSKNIATAYNILDNANDFRTLGYYGVDKMGTTAYDLETQKSKDDDGKDLILFAPFIPAVFDTWTEEYEKEHLRETGLTRRFGYRMSDIPLDGEITFADLPDYPPPYVAELKALQIELRIFDPVSRTIKKTTLEVNLAQ